MVQMPQNCHGILYLPSVGLKLEDLPIHGIQDHLIHVLGLPTIPCGLDLSLYTTSLQFEIPARRLITLWVAEGFLRLGTGDESPEHFAETVSNGADRSKHGSSNKEEANGKVRTCRLPGALRKLLLKANTVNKSSSTIQLKCWIVDRYNNNDASFNHIHGDDTDTYTLQDYYKKSLLFLSFDDREGTQPGEEAGNFLDRSISCKCFLLLRVLDLERVFSVNINFPTRRHAPRLSPTNLPVPLSAAAVRLLRLSCARHHLLHLFKTNLQLKFHSQTTFHAPSRAGEASGVILFPAPRDLTRDLRPASRPAPRPHSQLTSALPIADVFPMDKNELPKTVTTILNGHNYVLWSQDMRSFLKGHRLWRYVIGEIQAPVRSKDEEDTKFADRLEDWDCKNHQIITWFRHSTVPSIHQQFGRYENAKDVWDLLSRHYTTAGLSHEYQLRGLHVNMKQTPRQPINEFLSRYAVYLGIRMEQSTHIVKDPADATILATKRDQFHLIQFLMALTSEFEPVRATLLQQMQSLLLLHVLQALTSSRNGPKYCKNCHKQGHLLAECQTIQCRYCHKIGHIVYNCPTKPPKPGQSGILPRPVNPSVAAAAAAKTHPLIPLSHLSRYFLLLFLLLMLLLFKLLMARTLLLVILGSVSTSTLSLSDTYLIPNLTLNLISVGQLCELGFDLWFGSSGCRVQDPRTNQVLGTGRRVGRMFELTSLHLPSTSTPPPSHVAHTASVFPLSLWHLRLGHVSVQKLRTLISSGFLGQVKHDSVDCVSCQLAKQPALSFNNSDSFSHASFDLIHSDIWGPSPTATEHLSKMVGLESKHRHILDSVRAFLISASCPERFWGEAALTAVYTINRLPSSALQNVTPFERLYGTPASYSSLRVFGCACFVLLQPHEHSKLEPRSHLCCFLGLLTSLLLLLPANSPASPQEPAPPVDPVTDQTPLLPLRRSDRQAMTEELQALEKTHTWDLVDLPHGKSAIGCKWVYKIKTKSDGSIERYKARLVAKGYAQEYGIDYEETFAPVACITSVRSLLAIAAVHQWPLFQMDVKNAFLNGDLTEEVYMQAPPALFIRRSDKGMILLLLYVDDMIITGDDHSGISDFKLFLHQQFEMKDLGHLSYFLGLEVSSDSTGYYLSQAKYASDLLSRAGLTDTKVVSTPLEMNARLTPLDGTPLSDATLYRQLVGSLVYLTVTRPDIAHAVHLVSQFLSAPHSTHYAAVIHILRYIKGTMFHGLHFSAHSTLDLCAYSDADWAGDPTDCRSTTGFCFFLGDSLISWRSKKQHIVSRSSTEAEYRALADTTSELLALRWLLEDMGLTHSSPTIIHCDNRSAIQIAHNDVFHERTKHIEIDCHLVRHHLSAGILHLLPVSSSDQTADIFTKTFPPGRFRDLVSKLKMASVRPP
uniref:CCHC-type domain-containing protein n=1 Tax=Fagus sylvatica TaxID=28930 RepID=A0A2N9GCA0_FAGSY